jgi:hypothetical protein
MSSVQFDYDEIAANVREYIRSPASADLRKELENSVLFSVIATFVLVVVGVVLVCTVIPARAGFGLLRHY